MDILIQVLVLTVPSLIVLGIVYFMMHGFLEAMQKMFQEEHRRRKEETKIANHSILAPLRIQAHERMILFLERISPSNLVMRTSDDAVHGALLMVHRKVFHS